MSEAAAQSSFEDQVGRLEEIVGRLDAEDIPLEEALSLFEEAIARLKAANSMLERAELDVKRLTENDDGTYSLNPSRG